MKIVELEPGVWRIEAETGKEADEARKVIEQLTGLTGSSRAGDPDEAASTRSSSHRANHSL